MGILVLELLEKVELNRNLVSIYYFVACFFFVCIMLFSVYILSKCASMMISQSQLFFSLLCFCWFKFEGEIGRFVSVSDMSQSAKRKRFDVGAMMKARKEAKLLHNKIAIENQAIAEKTGVLHNLNMIEKRLDFKVSFPATFEIFSYTKVIKQFYDISCMQIIANHCLYIVCCKKLSKIKVG